MSGSAANAGLWTSAEVYIAPTGSTAPTDADSALDAAWKAVGLLDGSEGFTQARDEETNEIYAWGSLLIKKTKSKHKRTLQFSALEDNDTVFSLVNPGSTRTTASGLTTATVKVPTGNHEFMVVFQLNDGSKQKRRVCKRATVEEVGEVKESEEEVTVYQVTILLYPESDGTLFTEYIEAVV